MKRSAIGSRHEAHVKPAFGLWSLAALVILLGSLGGCVGLSPSPEERKAREAGIPEGGLFLETRASEQTELPLRNWFGFWRPSPSAASESAESAENPCEEFPSAFLPACYEMDYETLGQIAGRFDYILVGEGHTSACDHQVQAAVLAALAEAGHPPVVGLEMVGQDRQDVLNRFNGLDMPVAQLEEALDWPNSWGHAFSLYEPVFRAARRYRLPLYALNMPPEGVRDFQAAWPDIPDAMQAEYARFLPEKLLEPPQAQKESLLQQFQGHLAMAKDSGKTQFMLDRFFAVQSLWDSTMAERAVHLGRVFENPVVVLAGSGHVDFGWGIGSRIKSLDPEARILLVSPWRGGPPPPLGSGMVYFHCPVKQVSRIGLELEQMELPERSDTGARVLSVVPDSKADKAGFLAGDIILSAGGQNIDSLNVLHQAAMKAASGDGNLDFEVLRGEEILTLTIVIQFQKVAN